MDTSKDYIKMCERSEAIQLAWARPKSADFYAWRTGSTRHGNARLHGTIDYYDDNTDLVHGRMVMGDRRYRGDVIWLPRQHQLQELVGNKIKSWKLSEMFWEYLDGKLIDKVDKMSMEQLWLSFVMKEKYNKVWDGNDWIKGV